MSLLDGTGEEMAYQLEPGEVAICVRCESFWLDRADLREMVEHEPLCEHCGTGGFRPGYLSRTDKSRQLVERWDADVIACGFTAMPDLVADVLRDAGLSGDHYLLLSVLESYRRRGREAVYPSIDTLAERTGWSTRTVDRKLRDLRERGVIECERVRRYGHLAESRITRNGLDAALRQLVGDRLDDRTVVLQDDAVASPGGGKNEPFDGSYTTDRVESYTTELSSQEAEKPYGPLSLRREASLNEEADAPDGAAGAADHDHHPTPPGLPVEDPQGLLAPGVGVEAGALGDLPEHPSVVVPKPLAEPDAQLVVGEAVPAGEVRSIGAAGNVAGMALGNGGHGDQDNPLIGDERTVADLCDEELLSIFPGSTVGDPDDDAPPEPLSIFDRQRLERAQQRAARRRRDEP